MKVRWGYLAGLIVIIVMIAGGVNAVVDGSIVFSYSRYNMSTVIAYLIALVVIVFSVNAYRNTRCLDIRKATLKPDAFTMRYCLQRVRQSVTRR